MLIEDRSNDHAYFTMVPNVVIDKAKKDPRSLYIKMKRLARKNGEVNRGDRYLMKAEGIGRKGFEKSIKFLIDQGWIIRGEKKKIKSRLSTQLTNTYIITDIWLKNAEHFSEKKEDKNSL
jgi:hypothetical protein